MSRYERPADREPEAPIEWTDEHDWLAYNAARVLGGYPGPRSPIGYAIRSWVNRHGWQPIGRIIARMVTAGTRLSADEFMDRIDRTVERRIVIEALALPPIHVPAEAQAIGICALSRDRGLTVSMLGTSPTGALHPTECGWCAYPLDELLGWLRAFRTWTETAPEGHATMKDWWRTDRTERAAAIGAAQSVG